MVFNINSELFENLTFYPKNFCRKEDKFVLIEDGIRYNLNPNDSIYYQNQIISLVDFYKAIKKCEQFLWDNHPEWMKQSSEQFRLSFYERDGQATAFYETNINGKNPKEIKMCMSYFLNLHDFKFVLGHELGHFHEYLAKKELKPLTNEIINIIIGSILILLLMIPIASFILSFKEKLPEWMILIDILFAFGSLFYYFSYSAIQFNNILQSHYIEYEADKFAMKLFTECNTSYFKKRWLYSDTHPSNNLRILALNKNIRIYIPIIVPWFLSYCDSYSDFKKQWMEFFKEIPKTPYYFIEIIVGLSLDIKNKFKIPKINKSLNAIKNDLE